MHASVQVPHDEFPFCIFAMLSDPSIAPDLSESLNSPCELDDWSKGFLNFFNGVLGNAPRQRCMGQWRPDYRSLGKTTENPKVHELLRLQRLGGLATADGKATTKLRWAFGQRSRDVLRATVRQRKVLALQRMLLQSDHAAVLTAVGDVLSVRGFSLAEPHQAMRRARLRLLQRMEDVVIGDPFQVVPEVALSLVQLVPGSASVAEKLCRSRSRIIVRPTS